MYISLRAYGRHLGVSDSAFRKAIKVGRITPEADGTVDPAKSDAEWKRNTDVAQQRGEQMRKAVPGATFDAVSETLRKQGAHAVGTTHMQDHAANAVLKA